MLVIAHRGASGHAPEHTLAAYDLALQLGCDFLEQDLQMTSDGVLVCMHDDTLDRTALGCTGRIIDHAWRDLEECDVGTWFNDAFPMRARPAYTGERIPTLEQVFARYRDRAAFYIETKTPEAAPGMEAALLELLDRFDLRAAARTEWRVIIQSFSEASLRLIHGQDAALPLVQLIPEGTDGRALHAMLPRIAGYAVGIGPAFTDVDRLLVTAAHRHGLHVHPYTVNEEADMRRMAEARVDGMFTNFTDRLLALRPQTEPRGLEAVRRAAEAVRRAAEAARRRIASD